MPPAYAVVVLCLLRPLLVERPFLCSTGYTLTPLSHRVLSLRRGYLQLCFELHFGRETTLATETPLRATSLL